MATQTVKKKKKNPFSINKHSGLRKSFGKKVFHNLKVDSSLAEARYMIIMLSLG